MPSNNGKYYVSEKQTLVKSKSIKSFFGQSRAGEQTTSRVSAQNTEVDEENEPVNNLVDQVNK